MMKLILIQLNNILINTIFTDTFNNLDYIKIKLNILCKKNNFNYSITHLLVKFNN